MASIQGRVALVTGASSGIGHAAALALEQSGFLTIATARDETALRTLAERGCETAALDVTCEASIEATIRTMENRFGPVYALINCAGVPQFGPIEEVALDDVRQLFEVNVFGLVRLCQLVLPGMRRLGAGRIISVSAVPGEVTRPGSGLYGATTHALEAITASMRSEVREFGVDVISIASGPVDTPFGLKALASIPNPGAASPYSSFRTSLASAIEGAFAADSLLSAEDVARVIVRAASVQRPDSCYAVAKHSKLATLLRGVTPRRWEAALRKSFANSP